MLIHDVKIGTKDDTILQNSSQETLTSSKYDCNLDALIITIGSWKFDYNWGMANYVDSLFQFWYQRWSNPPKLQSETINILQAWLCFWCTFNHARELKIGKKINNDIGWLFTMSHLIPNITKSSKTPVRNHQCPLSITVFLMQF